MAAEQQNIVKTVLKLRAEVHHVLVSRGKDEAAEDSGTNKHDVELAAKFISSLGVAAHGEPPAVLMLPSTELLIAEAKCRLAGEFGTLFVTTSWVCFEPLTPDPDTPLGWRVRLVKLKQARKVGDGKHHLRSPKGKADLKSLAMGPVYSKSKRMQAATGLQLVDERGEEHGVMLDSFVNPGVRDVTLTLIREHALQLGATFEGFATRYNMTFVTAAGDDHGLNPSSCELVIQLVGDEGSSDQLSFRASHREAVQPGQKLKLHHERRANKEPYGEIQKMIVRLKAPKTVSMLRMAKPSWRVTEVRVVDMRDGRLTRFVGTLGWVMFGAGPVQLLADSDDQEALPPITTFVEELWEHQRRMPMRKYDRSHLFDSDPPPFGDASGKPRYKAAVALPRPSGGMAWSWVSEWEVRAASAPLIEYELCLSLHASCAQYEVSDKTDAEGWSYALHWRQGLHGESSMKDLVRQRRWVRTRETHAEGASEGVPPDA